MASFKKRICKCDTLVRCYIAECENECIIDDCIGYKPNQKPFYADCHIDKGAINKILKNSQFIDYAYFDNDAGREWMDYYDYVV